MGPLESWITYAVGAALALAVAVIAYGFAATFDDRWLANAAFAAVAGLGSQAGLLAAPHASRTPGFLWVWAAGGMAPTALFLAAVVDGVRHGLTPGAGAALLAASVYAWAYARLLHSVVGRWTARTERSA